MFAGGGASAAGSACAVQPTIAKSPGKARAKRKRSNAAVGNNCPTLLRFMSRMVVVSSPSSPGLELHHDGVPEAGFIFPQIGAETRASSRACVARSCGEEWTWYERCVSHHRSRAGVRNQIGRAHAELQSLRHLVC